MSHTVWLAAGVTAIATLLIRMLPLYWMQRRLARATAAEEKVTMPAWPAVLAPLMIAALLGVSMVPQPGNMLSWGATMAGSLVTLLWWYKTRTLGMPVTAGVAAYALVIVIGS